MIKLIRNKMIAELVLDGHTLSSVGIAFELSAPRVRQITQRIIGRALGYSSLLMRSTNTLSIRICRNNNPQGNIIPDIRMLT